MSIEIEQKTTIKFSDGSTKELSGDEMRELYFLLKKTILAIDHQPLFYGYPFWQIPTVTTKLSVESAEVYCVNGAAT